MLTFSTEYILFSSKRIFGTKYSKLPSFQQKNSNAGSNFLIWIREQGLPKYFDFFKRKWKIYLESTTQITSIFQRHSTLPSPEEMIRQYTRDNSGARFLHSQDFLFMHKSGTVVNSKLEHPIMLTFHKRFSSLLCSDRGNQTRYPFWTKAQPEPDCLT